MFVGGSVTVGTMPGESQPKGQHYGQDLWEIIGKLLRTAPQGTSMVYHGDFRHCYDDALGEF